MKLHNRQSGITFFGFLIFLVVAGAIAFAAMRLIPLYQEFGAVKNVTAALAKDPETKNMSASDIKQSFLKRMSINYSENVKREHVRVDTASGGWMMHVDYEVRRPLAYNVDVVVKFSHERELPRGDRQ